MINKFNETLKKYNPLDKLAEKNSENKKLRALYEAKWVLYHSVLCIQQFVVILLLFGILLVLAIK